VAKFLLTQHIEGPRLVDNNFDLLVSRGAKPKSLLGHPNFILFEALDDAGEHEINVLNLLGELVNVQTFITEG
jgi:hypothetical protein